MNKVHINYGEELIYITTPNGETPFEAHYTDSQDLCDILNTYTFRKCLGESTAEAKPCFKCYNPINSITSKTEFLVYCMKELVDKKELKI